VITGVGGDAVRDGESEPFARAIFDIDADMIGEREAFDAGVGRC
jgi:hypothetical protein